ncbi:MAG: hypothetical protein HKO62_10785 [Gammaproteobacteria bacterium]|nr:hypothetical protein [Gammaproteobacteria bacterium]
MNTCESEIALAQGARESALIDARTELLPRWAWLWFPPLMLLAALPLCLTAPASYQAFFAHELGVIELMTPALLVVGVVYGVAAARLFRADVPGARIWLVLVTLGCIYFAGEELSWGQHLFGWETPEALGRLNNQNETNLHNISTWLDQKPRLLLELWVIVGGLVMPWRLRRHPVEQTRSFADWFWPTYELFPVALLAFVIRLPERLADLGGLRYSEFQEYYFALFLTLYLASVRRRLEPGAA